MGYQTGSRRGGQKFQKSQHEKKKTRTHKLHSKNKQMLEERQIATAEETTTKTLNSLKRLGEQRFAVSPFSQYFDDWLISLEEVLSEFEANPDISLDETFVEKRERITANAEQELAKLRKEETCLNQALKDLAEKNHLLLEIDAEYAAQTRELRPKRNAEIQNLTADLRNLEVELDRVKATKTSLFGAFTKKAKNKKGAEIGLKLESAKTALEAAVKNFKVDQEKLHDDYEKKKSTIIAQVQNLEKAAEKLETDWSLAVRQAASEALINAVKGLPQRKTCI